MIYHNPDTATLEEARHVVELIRKRMQHANGEDHADLSYDLETWERLVREQEQLAEWRARQDAAAIEEDRRFEQYRDDKIAARHGGR